MNQTEEILRALSTITGRPRGPAPAPAYTSFARDPRDDLKINAVVMGGAPHPIAGRDVPIPQDEPAAPAQELTEFPPAFVSVRK